MGLCVSLSMNSEGIFGGFRGNAGFSGKLWVGVVSGDLGGQKAFAQIATHGFLDPSPKDPAVLKILRRINSLSRY